MASSTNSLGHAAQFGCALVVVAAIWLGRAHAIPPITPSICGAPFSANPADCEHGHYTLRSALSICPDRTYCYIGWNKRCREDDPTTRCADGYKCYCGVCQMDLIICPQKNHMMQQWLKRIQRNYLEYNI